MKVQIGNATLYCGDCRELFPDLPPADVVVTDPPYGIGWSKPYLENGNSRAHPGIQGDRDTSARDDLLKLHAGRSIVFGSFQAPFPAGVKQVLIWHKPADSGLFGTVSGYRRDVEPIFLCGDWPAAPVVRSSVLTAKASFRGRAALNSGGHPHTKPIDLLERLITPLADIMILDPFMGSGTAGVACMNLGRKFIGVEIERQYFDMACERVEQAQRQIRICP